jgi:hypothetical protein
LASPSESNDSRRPVPSPDRAPPTGFLLPFSASTASPLTAGFTFPLRSVLGLSQPLDGLLLAVPCGPVSSRRHSWGCYLQGFPLSESNPASPRSFPSWRWASKPAIAFRALLPRKVRWQPFRLVTDSAPRSPPGLHPLQGPLLPRRGSAFTRPPPMSFQLRPHCDRELGSPESYRTRNLACLSRDCRPS